MRKLIVALLAAASLTVGAVALAGPPGFGPGFEIVRVLHDLDLSPEQKAALKELREANAAERAQDQAEREETLARFKAELLSDKPDAKALHALIDAKSDAAIERAHDHLDAVLEVHAILTPAQRQQVADALETMREQRRGRGPGHE